jgi:exodeoxyribonuclease VII large subunit
MFEFPIRIYTVSQINSRIRDALSRPFKDIVIEGEVSNFKVYPSGHLYFTLKDDAASLKAVMFNFYGRYPQGMISDGTAVICHGRIDVYEKRGEYRLLVDDMEVKGRGLLQIKFELLKEKLFKEGLFDSAKKLTLPFLATKIGIVTSPAGAAIRDMLKIALGKFSNLQLIIYPVRVQGDQAAAEVVEGIEYFNREAEVDVIILGRGGGSYEDLACFNEETVARAIYASHIPIVSGIGHEIDFTITDFCADLRAPTPTAAADMVVKSKDELYEVLQYKEQQLYQGMKKRLEEAKQLLFRKKVELKDQRDFITKHRMYLDDLASTMERNLLDIIDKRRILLESYITRLGDLNPESILKRGYSITMRADSKLVVNKVDQVSEGEKVLVRLYKGSLDCLVENTVD